MVKNGRELRAGDLVVGEFFRDGSFHCYTSVILIVEVLNFVPPSRSPPFEVGNYFEACVIYNNRELSKPFAWPFDREFKVL